MLGPPTEDAMRITFLLYDGSHADMTFCGTCADTLNVAGYLEIWNKVIRSWLRQLGETRPDWFQHQFENGLLVELHRVKWKEFSHA